MHSLTFIKKNILFKYQQKTRKEDFSLLLRLTKICFLFHFVDLCASVDCNQGICEVLSESQTKCNCSTGWFGEFCDVGKFREKKWFNIFLIETIFASLHYKSLSFLKKIACQNTKNVITCMVVWCLSLNNAFSSM